jgi:flagellar hook-associated protein 2
MSTSTTSASSSIASFYTMDGTTRLNGSEFASGLDTQNLIKALTAKTSEKIAKQQQLQQKVEWKQEMYHEIEDLLQSFSDTYLSYSTKSSLNLMSKRFFDGEQLVSSNSGVVTATGDASVAGNVVINSITQLATAAVLNGSEVSVPNIRTKALGNTVSSSSYLNLDVNGTSYTISLGSNVELTYNDGNISDESLQKIAASLNNQLKEAKISGKVQFSASDGSITMVSAENCAKITGASQNFIDGLGLTAQTDESGKVTSYTLDGSVQKGIASLSTQLAGASLTMQLDGLSKTITFNQSEISQYEDVESLKSYLQNKLNTAFGSGKITVSNDSDTLSFSVADSTSVLTFTSASASGVLGASGLLHIRSGETNRLELDKKLDELAGELNVGLSTTAVDEEGKPSYSITVNGKEFTFSGDTELNTVINTINNDATANVTISYSQTLNRFRVVADDTGSQGRIDISDNPGGGNLAAALFGIDADGDTTASFTAGQDLMMNVMLGGTATDIVRGTNSFTLDGVALSVSGTTDSKVTFSAGDTSDDLYEKISTFVETYNKIITTVNNYVTQMPASQSTKNGGGKTYQPLTDEQKKEMTDTEIEQWQKKAKQGLLFGDSQLSSLQNDLRNAMETIVSSTGMSLADLGISTKAYDYTSGGKLVIDETKLKSALKNNLSQVEQIFTNSDGIAQRLNDVIIKNIGVYGNSGILVDVAGSSTLIGTDNSQFANQINQYQKNIKDLQTQLTNERNRLQMKFTQMENIISRLVTQFDYISNMSAV